MKIAIPIHGNRVMPRFGCTRTIIIATVENGRSVAHKRIAILPRNWIALPEILISEGVSVMICGGIHPRFQNFIEARNIRLIWGIVGEWQEVLQAYLQGTLQSGSDFCLHRRDQRNARFRRRQQGGKSHASI